MALRVRLYAARREAVKGGCQNAPRREKSLVIPAGVEAAFPTLKNETGAPNSAVTRTVRSSNFYGRNVFLRIECY
jgi:hypothetical protein